MPSSNCAVSAPNQSTRTEYEARHVGGATVGYSGPLEADATADHGSLCGY